MSKARVLPSESVQKEFEKDPLKILEEIRTDENSDNSIEEEKTEPEIILKPGKNPQSIEAVDDINNINSQKNNLTCKNDFMTCDPNIISNDTGNIAVNRFYRFCNFYSKEEGKSDEDNIIYTSVINSYCSNNAVFINVVIKTKNLKSQ